jgi:outer membrane protein OmpA-like peptidoglycan-associated protein/tetratricopeptide (TPR) repeat protein
MKTLLSRISTFVLVLFSVSAFSQSKKLWIGEGDKAFNQQDYTNAILFYKKVLDDTVVLKTSNVLPYEVQLTNLKLKKDSVKLAKAKEVAKDTTAKVTTGREKKGKNKNDMKHLAPEDYTRMQLGHAYRLNADHQNALKAYKECVDKNIPDARYYYALSLVHTRQYQEALNEFEKYVASNPSNDSLSRVAQKREAGCFLALDSNNVIKTLQVTMPDTSVFNKGNSSFAAAFLHEGSKVVFTSARKGNTILDPKKEDPEYLCDLYWTELKDTSWTPATNFGAPLNSSIHEGAAFANDKAIYFTRWSNDRPNEAFIYKANNQSEKYFLPQKLSGAINPVGFKTTHPFVTPDGKKLIFSSNRPGGKGGMDLWMCDIDENGMTGEPKNIGSPINTAGDEVTPFLHGPSGMLYFSSNGLTGLGGLDIFKAEYNPIDNVFGIPQNVNAPINSSKDDSYFIADKTGLKGFFTSDRAECEGGNCYKLYQFASKPITFDVSGIVFDGTTNEPMANALVTIRNVHNDDETYFVLTDEKGNYFQQLKPNSEYFMKGQKNKFLGDAASHSTKDKSTTTHFEQDFFLSKIPEGEVEIEGIEYDFNSATLRPVSMASLDKIVDLLKLNDNLQVELEANTDSRGNDAYNMKLSEGRAKSCVDYLVSKGIDASRLRAKGFGETNPLIKEADINKMKKKSPEWEAAHQKNRRTALRIVGESEIKIINKGK